MFTLFETIFIFIIRALEQPYKRFHVSNIVSKYTYAYLKNFDVMWRIAGVLAIEVKNFETVIVYIIACYIISTSGC